MKKKYLSLGGAVALLALLGVSYGLLSSYNRTQEAISSESESESGIEVQTADFDQITSFQLANGDISYTLTKTNDSWTCVQDESFPLSEDSVTELIQGLASFHAVRDLGSLQDGEDYGFSNSSPSVTLTLSDESSLHLVLGTTNSLTDDYYLKSEENEHLYTVSSSVAGFFSKTLLDLAWIESFPVISSSNVSTLSITEDNETLVFESSVTGSVKSWTIARSSDGSTTADTAEKALVNTVTTLVDQLGNLSFDQFVDHKKENLENYGFNNPSLTLTFQYTASTEETSDETEDSSSEILSGTLYIGDMLEDGSYYVHLAGSNNVYTISADSLTYFQDLEYEDYLASEEETASETETTVE